MEIVLIRHGQPVSATNERLNSKGFVYWVKRYHHADIAEHSRPNWHADSLIKNAYLISSDLKRAKDSAQIAFNRKPKETLRCLREMDIPRYNLPFVLRAWTWVYLNRALWMLGKKGKFESYREAKERAVTAAEALIDKAEEHGVIVAVGHGFMNLHIRNHLARNGWIVKEKDNDYWGKSRLVLNLNE